MKKLSLLALLLASITQVPLEAAYVFQNGKLMDVKEAATHTLEEHYTLGIEAIKKKEWKEAITQFRIVTINFPDAIQSKEAFYFLGVSYYHNEEMDLANENFSEYLKKEATPKYFEQVFQYKLAIADAFKNGAKKHLFGARVLPQLMGDKDLAIALYDEVANTFPNDELAAKAWLAKGELFREKENFRQAIEAYQTVIKKFSRTDFAAMAYTAISDAYFNQAKLEHQNPDLLALAQINLKRFSQEFPRDARAETAQQQLSEMKESLAASIYETGCFYERKSQPQASFLYYNNVISQFPETHAAQMSKERIAVLQQRVPSDAEKTF